MTGRISHAREPYRAHTVSLPDAALSSSCAAPCLQQRLLAGLRSEQRLRIYGQLTRARCRAGPALQSAQRAPEESDMTHVRVTHPQRNISVRDLVREGGTPGSTAPLDPPETPRSLQNHGPDWIFRGVMEPSPATIRLVSPSAARLWHGGLRIATKANQVGTDDPCASLVTTSAKSHGGDPSTCRADNRLDGSHKDTLMRACHPPASEAVLPPVAEATPRSHRQTGQACANALIETAGA